MAETNVKKRQLLIFLGIAYGVTYLMGIWMWHGNAASVDLSAFPSAQMMYPAAGVMLACLLTGKGNREIPRWFYGTFLLMTLLMIALSILSVLKPELTMDLYGSQVSVWVLAVQYVLIGGSIVCWITLLAAGRARRAAYGLRFQSGGKACFCILLFLLLYLLRAGINYALAGQADIMVEILKSPACWSYLAFMPVNFLLAFAAFFGEEYGWRYYLQPILQKRYGLRKGVLILGVVWGLWHLPVDFFYYTSPGQGLIMTVSQIITCVTLGIFFAYAYRKTGNLWVPVILHFMNNNLVPMITNTYSAEVLQGQEVTWGMIPVSLILNGALFGGFLFSKEFRE